MELRYRAAVYSDRINVRLPKSLGPVDLRASNLDGGVLITIKATPHGRYAGSETPDGWQYSWRPSGMKLPRIGMSDAELRKGLTEDGVLELWLPPGRKVLDIRRGPARSKPPEPATPAPTDITGLTRLGDLVREINARKAELGDALCLEVTDGGRLRALVEYS